METATYKLRNSENILIAEIVDTAIDPTLVSEFLIENNNRFNKRLFVSFLHKKGIVESVRIKQYIN